MKTGQAIATVSKDTKSYEPTKSTREILASSFLSTYKTSSYVAGYAVVHQPTKDLCPMAILEQLNKAYIGDQFRIIDEADDTLTEFLLTRFGWMRLPSDDLIF